MPGSAGRRQCSREWGCHDCRVLSAAAQTCCFLSSPDQLTQAIPWQNLGLVQCCTLPPPVASDRAHLLQANDDRGASHETSDDRLGQEVGDPTQLEKAHSSVQEASQERDLHSSSMSTPQQPESRRLHWADACQDYTSTALVSTAPALAAQGCPHGPICLDHTWLSGSPTLQCRYQAAYYKGHTCTAAWL